MSIIILILVSLFQTPDQNSDPVFILDENGLITFMEVVDSPSQDLDLKKNAVDYLNSLNKGEPEIENENSASIEYGFLLYEKKIGKSTHGKLSFSILIETKADRYRYILQNFIFQPYERNRYSRFVPTSDDPVPLEELVNDPDKLWKSHTSTILNKISRITEELKARMKNNTPEEKIKRVKISDDW